MMRTIVAGVVAALIATSAAAQSTELGMMAGFTPAASLDRHAPELDDASIDGGVTFSINGSRFLSEHWGFGVEWAQQLSGFGIETAGVQTTLYDMSIAHFHGYAVYRFGDAAAKVRPFAFGGAGMKFFWARDLESETKLSFGMGGGLSYFVSRNLAFEGRVTYKPTMMNDSEAGEFCDPFGFCQSTLQQFEFGAGVRFRF
jgi:opacity protein-like surface antigen